MQQTQTRLEVAEASAAKRRRGFRRPTRRSTTGILAGMCLLFSMLAPAPAGAVQATNISGNAVASDCNNGLGLGALEMTGDLEGCLTFYVDDYTCTELNGFAFYEESGTEVFDGTVGGKEGRFRTEYTLAATYLAYSCASIDNAILNGGAWPGTRQLTGGCDHEIIGVSGAFNKKSGLVIFHDIIPEPGVSGASNFYYTGYFA